MIRKYLFATLFLLTLAPACALAQAKAYSALNIEVNAEEALSIGRKIWHNEGAGKIENLTVWNAGEDFPSFGIGHFIWFPRNVDAPFTESFPDLLLYLSARRKLPSWLDPKHAAPWPNRADFQADYDSERMNELRKFLVETLAEQTYFIIARLEAAAPTLIERASDERQRTHIQRQFARMAATPAGTFALIDYVNFKGEGISPKERYKGQGWGLFQVLNAMPGDSDDPIDEFVRAADRILTLRVKNADRDESRWLPGWRKRLKGYKQQMVD